MQSNDKTTFRMQVFYYRNRWYCFIKPAIQKWIDEVTGLLDSRIRQHIVAPVLAKMPYIHPPKVEKIRFAVILLAIVVLVVTPNVFPSGNTASEGANASSRNGQTLTTGDATAPTYARGGLYAPKLIYPVGNVEISSPYGWRNAPCVGCSSDHNGTDFHVPAGTPVRAAMSGTVLFTGWQGTYGYLIVIDAGYGYVTYYAHMIDGSIPAGIVAGSKVDMGDVVGLVGCTGACTGAHLHFGLQLDGSFVDPLPVLQRYAS